MSLSRVGVLLAALVLSACGITTRPEEVAQDAAVSSADAVVERSDAAGSEAPDASVTGSDAAESSPDTGSVAADAAGPGPDAGVPGADAALPPDTGPAFAAEFFVAPDGDDTKPGTQAQPFATLEKARDAVRALKSSGGVPPGGYAVTLRGGVYPRTASFKLLAQDSGEAGRPIVYRAFPGEAPRLLGGRVVPSTAFSPVTSASPAWARLDPSVRGQVVSADLQALGITDYGTLQPRGMSSGAPAALEVAFDRLPLQLARWPDATEHEAFSTSADDTVQLYGTGITPDVTGTYAKNGTSNGVNAYARQGLVGGKQYNLYRHNWDYQGKNYTAWFLTTNKSGYPGNTDPWWSLYAAELGTMNPSNGAAGKPSTTKPGAIRHGFAAIAEAVSDTVFRYFGDRPQRWAAATDVWFHGYWKYSWADQHLGASAIDTTARTVTLSQKHNYGMESGMPYYAENLLEEITVPGEWFLDRATGVLYLLPPKPVAQAEIVVSLLASPLVQTTSASHVTFQGLVFESGRVEQLRVDDGADVRALGCRFLNAGTSAVKLRGTDHAVDRCEVSQPGDCGVTLAGGKRATLEPGRNAVTNSEIHAFSRWSWTYNPGVRVDGVGHVVAHNLFYDAPHSAILYSGNDHLFEFNEIHDVLRYSSDAGAIYSGRDWGYRGNRIRFNFIHDIQTFIEGYGVHGVYLDDCLAGVHVFGNVLYKISGLGVLHGGGRDNVIENNLMVRCGVGLGSDSRGLTAINNTAGDSWNLLERLTRDGIKTKEPPWSTRWPELAAVPSDWATLTAAGTEWLYPEDCVFSRNLGWQTPRFTTESNNGGTGTFNKFKEMKDNVADQDPLFEDEAKGDLRLKAGSPAYAIPGFQRIPFEEIGIRP